MQAYILGIKNANIPESRGKIPYMSAKWYWDKTEYLNNSRHLTVNSQQESSTINWD